jgi:hypothetical protein
MALNPFEQLRLLAPEPRAAFEEIVGILLKDHGKSDGQGKVYFGDAGVDAYKGSFGQEGELIVYQSKYFPDQWQESQKKTDQRLIPYRQRERPIYTQGMVSLYSHKANER